MMKNFQTNPIAMSALRYFLYAALVTLMALVITAEAHFFRDYAHLFSENSILENLQLVALAAVVFTAHRAGRILPERAPVASVLMSAASIAFIRELDFFFDRIARHTWKVLVLLVLIAAVTHGWRHRKALKEGVLDFINRASFGMMAGGFVTVFCFSRLMGRGALWQTIMGENYMRVVKNVVEESIELLGYTLILIATIEFLWEAIQAKRKATDSQT